MVGDGGGGVRSERQLVVAEAQFHYAKLYLYTNEAVQSTVLALSMAADQATAVSRAVTPPDAGFGSPV